MQIANEMHEAGLNQEQVELLWETLQACWPSVSASALSPEPHQHLQPAIMV